MGTSKSVETSGRWHASVSLFSGRPDPAWDVDEGLARQLVDLWDGLEVTSSQPPSPPALGYRGCMLREEHSREWRAFRGFVHLLAGESSETRRDPDRVFERALLASAPTGVLPPNVMS